MKICLTFLFLIFPLLQIHLVYAMNGLNELNAIRDEAGMQKFIENSKLQKSAQNHADYLHRHYRGNGFISAHEEQLHLPYFTGKTPSERAKYSGYEHQLVLENVSVGDTLMKDAVEGLMGAIYHRFTFLDFAADEVGIGANRSSYVFVLGRKDLVSACLNPPQQALAHNLIQCGSTNVTKVFFDGLCRNLPHEAIFEQAWGSRCSNGKILNAAYMDNFCQNPPQQALFRTHGRYYDICNNKHKIKADWFEQFCNNLPQAARHSGVSRFYQLCNTRIRKDWLEHQCNANPAGIKAGYYQKICHNEQKLSVEFIDDLTAEKHHKNPKIVYWPAANADEIPPAFFEENPDPLPDLSVSGYPVSIQVNPDYGEQIAVKRFRMYKIGDKGQLQSIQYRLLDQQTDPNGKLTKHQFALFPLHRLEWATQYKVESILSINGKSYSKNWTFKTKNPNTKIIVLKETGQKDSINMGEEVLLYRPPSTTTPYSMKDVIARFPAGTQIEMKSLDLNSATFRVIRSNCNTIQLEFNDGFLSVLEVTGCF